MKYRSHRFATQFPVQVCTPIGRQNAQVINVNTGGAQLSGLHDLQRGDKIQLDVLSHHVEAVVLWADEKHAGVCFRPNLSSHLLDTLQRCNTRRAGGYSPSVGFQLARF